jgi:hypothetical protein
MTRKIIETAEELLDRQGQVSTLDLLLALGYLRSSHIRDWKRGMLAHLELAASADPESWARAMEVFHLWGEERGLRRALVDYPAMNRAGVRYLRFTETGDRILEDLYRTAYVSPQGARAGAGPEQEKAVYWTTRESKCARCESVLYAGSFRFLAGKIALCLPCAGLDDLVFLPAGDASLTREARQRSERCAVVLRFSRAMERYERKGLLVEAGAVDPRYRVVTAIVKLFPGCPPEDALDIASRFARGQSLDAEALRFAVRAAVLERTQDRGEAENLLQIWIRP